MEKINGRKFIEIICQRLEDEGQLLFDSNIVMKINTMSDRELNQIVSLGDVVDWHNKRIIKERKATIADVKVYKCTDCGARTYLKDNAEITVGFCKKCGHPLWNPAEQPVLISVERKYKEL